MAETIERGAEYIATLTQNDLNQHDHPADAIRSVLYTLADYIATNNGFSTGRSLTIVTSKTAMTNRRLNQACQTACQHEEAENPTIQ